jgi:hypothetical protein
LRRRAIARHDQGVIGQHVVNRRGTSAAPTWPYREDHVLARTRKWVESWDRIKGLPELELREYVLGKCRNGYQVAKKPSRNQKDAWVTLLAEPDKNKHQLSAVAMHVVEYVRRKLREEGYDFELNLDETGGVAYAEVHFRTLTKKSKAS